MGLGLAICQTIMNAHDGTVDVERNAERGTTFSFSLPVLSGGRRRGRSSRGRHEDTKLNGTHGGRRSRRRPADRSGRRPERPAKRAARPVLRASPCLRAFVSNFVAFVPSVDTPPSALITQLAATPSDRRATPCGPEGMSPHQRRTASRPRRRRAPPDRTAPCRRASTPAIGPRPRRARTHISTPTAARRPASRRIIARTRPRLGTDRDADCHLAPALGDGMSEDGIEPEAGHAERERSEQGQQRGPQPPGPHLPLEQVPSTGARRQTADRRGRRGPRGESGR